MRTMLQYLGYLLILSSISRVVPIGAAMYYGESYSLFVIGLFVSLGLGFLFLHLSSRILVEDSGLTLHRGFLLAALSFTLLPLIGALSFLSSFDYSFVNAFFESLSGFTTTGLTLYSSLEELPRSLLLWRALTQWMGGIGIVLVFLFIFSHLNVSSSGGQKGNHTQSTLNLYHTQGLGEKIKGNIKSSMKLVLGIYSTYTLLGFALLYLVGLSFFEAVSITFTALSTGGFGVHDVFYQDSPTLLVICLLMLLGGTSFLAHSKLFSFKWKEFFYSYEKNILLFLITFSTVVCFLFFPNFQHLVFELISAFTTTGFSMSSSISLLPQIVIFFMMIGMIIGGSGSSTSGGVKVFRVYKLFRAISWRIKKMVSPRTAIIPLEIHGELVEDEELITISVFVFAYFFLLVLGTIIFMSFGYDFLNSSFQIVSALGTVGLQTVDLVSLNVLLKGVLMIAMIFGRLEILPLFILFKSGFVWLSKDRDRVIVS